MLPRLYNRYTKPPIKLYWWRYDHPHKLNFGDEITPLLIEGLWGYRSVWSPPESCDLAGAGSILEILQRKANDNHIHIWGSGFIQDGQASQNENLEFHAVRGNLTRSRIKADVPTGDPGLLMPLIVKPSAKKYRFGIVPHYVDADNPQVSQFLEKNNDSIAINVLDSPTSVAQQISSCDIILSSSLHGIILADAYGIPNAHIHLSGKVTGDGYKFRDYGSSVGRIIEPLSELNRVSNIESRLAKTGSLTVASLQNQLIKSFPF